jgi:hypothetical protein
MRRPDPCSFNTVSRSRYSAPPRGWRPGPYPFNTILRFRYSVSVRGLRFNDFSCGFIFIDMAKIVVGSPSLTQSLLLYPGFGTGYVRQHRRICSYYHSTAIFVCHYSLMQHYPMNYLFCLIPFLLYCRVKLIAHFI